MMILQGMARVCNALRVAPGTKCGAGALLFFSNMIRGGHGRRSVRSVADFDILQADSGTTRCFSTLPLSCHCPISSEHDDMTSGVRCAHACKGSTQWRVIGGRRDSLQLCAARGS